MRKANAPVREKTTLVIADGTAMGCELLRNQLSSPKYSIKVIASAVDQAGTLEVAAKHNPDVALVSAGLREGPRSGFELVRQLRAAHPKTRVILLLDSPDRDHIVEAFRNGASGVFFRSDSLERLWKSIRSVHLGQVWASSRELQYLLEELVQTMPFHVVDVHGGVLLTEREDQVVRLVAEGYTNREISKELSLSEHTVKNYIFRVFDKLGVSTRVELALYAMNQRQAGALSVRGSGKLAS